MMGRMPPGKGSQPAKPPVLKPRLPLVRRLRRWACFAMALAILVTAVLFLPPMVLPGGVDVILKPKRATWQGVLKVWNVVSWRTGRGSMSSVLNAAAAATEKKQRGLFITVEGMDETAFLARLAGGDRPDILSFPGGMTVPLRGDMVSLSAQGLSGLPEALAACANEESWALPWMWCGTMVLANQPMAATRGVTLPEGEWTWDEMNDAAGRLAHTMKNKRRTSVPGFLSSGRYALSWALAGGKVNQDVAPVPQVAWENFAAGQAALLACTPWEVGAMDRLRERDKGFQTKLLPIPNDLPMGLLTQWVSLVETESPEKLQMMTAFLSELVGPNIQKKLLEQTGCLPVVSMEGWEQVPDTTQALQLARVQGWTVAVRPGIALPDADIDAATRGDEAALLQIHFVTHQANAPPSPQDMGMLTTTLSRAPSISSIP